MTARLGGLILVGLGVASGWFALAGDYETLMNPAFRWVTGAGAVLLLGLGLVCVWKPVGGSLSALAIFGAFLALVVVARPDRGGVAPLFAPPAGGPTIDRTGYEPLRGSALFQSLDQEALDLAEAPVAMRGIVKRLPSLDAQGEFILLEPMMACCLADAVAFGVRVKDAGSSLPEDGSWVYAFGDLRQRDRPVPTPPFRVGAILFVPVSRVHRLEAHEVVSAQAMLGDLFEQIPEEFAATFRRLVVESGLADTLRGDGPLTVFALHDAAFESMPEAAREDLRSMLEGLVVRGTYTKLDLADIPSLTTLAGTTLPVRVENARVRIGGARVLLGPVEARNGKLYVVHPLPKHADR